MEWMIIVVTLASPQDARTGETFPTVQMERFADQAECERAGKALTSMTAAVSGRNATPLMRFSCGEVEGFRKQTLRQDLPPARKLLNQRSARRFPSQGSLRRPDIWIP